jgi:hypothetical protein
MTVQIITPFSLKPVRKHVWILAAPHIRVVVKAKCATELTHIGECRCHPALRAFVDHWVERVVLQAQTLCDKAQTKL